MINSQQLAIVIKSLAKSKKIPISKMLFDCELSINTLSSMQSGGYYPRLEAITKIADYLDCSVDYLLGRTSKNNNNDLSEQEKTLINSYRAHPDMQNAVNTLLGINATDNTSDNVIIYRAARSTDDHADEIKSVSRDFIQKLQDAPETDDEL